MNLLDSKGKLFKQDLGSKAKVHRETEQGERAFKANGMLKDIGHLTKPDGDCEYLGSAAVHAYIKKGSEFLVGDDEALIVTQTSTMQGASANIANAAAIQLDRQLQDMYTGKMQKKKSGF